MPLRRAGDPIGPAESGVEPLWRVRRNHLLHQHVGGLIVECLRILVTVEVIVISSPTHPASCQTVSNLLHAPFRAEQLNAVLVEDRLAIIIELWNACLAEIFLCDDIGSDL